MPLAARGLQLAENKAARSVCPNGWRQLTLRSIFAKQQLLFSNPPVIIHTCKVYPVVAAVHFFARTGNLGLKVRSKSKVSESPRYSLSCRGLSVFNGKRKT